MKNGPSWPVRDRVPLDAGQREHDLREVLNARRRIVRTGAPWRLIPNDFPPWASVYQQTPRWLRAGALAHRGHPR